MHTPTVYLLLVAMLVLAGSVHSAQWLQLVPIDPAHPGQCHDSVTNSYHAIGTQFLRPGACEQLSCSSHSEKKLMITGTSCTYASKFPANCKLESDLTQDYPECCPKLKCDGDVEDGEISYIG